LPSARQKVLDKEVIVDIQFIETSLSRVNQQSVHRVFSRLYRVP
jgi:hypothetical protein